MSAKAKVTVAVVLPPLYFCNYFGSGLSMGSRSSFWYTGKVVIMLLIPHYVTLQVKLYESIE